MTRWKPYLLVPCLLLGLLCVGPPAHGADESERLAQEWNGDLEKVRESLEDGKWRKARRGAEKTLESMKRQIKAGEAAWGLPARGTLYRALAYAGDGHMDKAEWHWHVAESLDKDLAWEDLGPFGDAGRALDAYRRGAESEKAKALDYDEGNPDFVAPVARQKLVPRYPKTINLGDVQGTTVYRLVVGTDGRARMPELIESDNLTQAFATLDQAQQWRFKPGTYRGEPTPLFYKLTVSFSSHRLDCTGPEDCRRKAKMLSQESPPG